MFEAMEGQDQGDCLSSPAAILASIAAIEKEVKALVRRVSRLRKAIVAKARSPREPNKIAVLALRVFYVVGTQREAAKVLSTELKRRVNQGQVSKWIFQAKKWMAWGNVLPALEPAGRKKPVPLDPAKIDLGRNPERRPKKQRWKFSE